MVILIVLTLRVFTTCSHIYRLSHHGTARFRVTVTLNGSVPSTEAPPSISTLLLRLRIVATTESFTENLYASILGMAIAVVLPFVMVVESPIGGSTVKGVSPLYSKEMVLIWDGLGLGFLYEESVGKVIVIEAPWN